MSDSNLETSVKPLDQNVTLIHYVDVGKFYSIYGVVTLIVVLLLLWFMVRTIIKSELSIEGMLPMETAVVRAFFPELEPAPALNLQLTDVDKPKPYNLQYASYGDVPIVFYESNAKPYTGEWYDNNKNMYIHNSRSLFQETGKPIESIYW